MYKKSHFSWLLLVIALVGGFLLYNYVIKTAVKRKAVETAINEGCEAMAEKFEEQKEEIVEDLNAILSKMDDLDEEKSELREQIEELRQDIQSDSK